MLKRILFFLLTLAGGCLTTFSIALAQCSPLPGKYAFVVHPDHHYGVNLYHLDNRFTVTLNGIQLVNVAGNGAYIQQYDIGEFFDRRTNVLVIRGFNEAYMDPRHPHSNPGNIAYAVTEEWTPQNEPTMCHSAHNYRRQEQLIFEHTYTFVDNRRPPARRNHTSKR